MNGKFQHETTRVDSTHPKMTDEQRKQYLKRLYKLASDHYTPEEKEAYLNKLRDEQADESMIRAAAMQVYRARKAKEKHDSHKEHSPASVASPLETKAQIKSLRDRFFLLFSCADLKVVEEDGKSMSHDGSAWLCGLDDKFLHDFENDIIEKHFTVPRARDNPSLTNSDVIPLTELDQKKTSKNFTTYEASNLDKFLETNLDDDRGFLVDDFGNDNIKDAAFVSATRRSYSNQSGKVISRPLFLKEGIDDSEAPRTIYIAPNNVEEDSPVTNISTSLLDTKDGMKTIVIVPSTPKKRKSKPKTNKIQRDDNEIPFDEQNKIKTERLNNLVESVKNLPFDEASYTIAFNAEDFVDQLANDLPAIDDFLKLDLDDVHSQHKGLTVEELALDVEYQYKR